MYLEIILYDPLPLLVLLLLFLLGQFDPLICRLKYFCLFLEDLVQSHCQEGTHGMTNHRTTQLHAHACTYKGPGNTYPARALKRKRMSLELPPSFLALHKKVHVCMCAVRPVALCSHGQVVRLTVCESDTPSSNPAQCSFFLFFSLTTSYTCNLLACTYICVTKLVTWSVGPLIVVTCTCVQ